MISTRSKRQSFLGQDSEKILSNATVGIVGLCGGGSPIAQELAHIGVDHFRLFDPENVEEPNLNRMIGATPVDALEERPKVEVIRDLIHAIRPSATVDIYRTKWQESHPALRSCTGVFGCPDNFGCRDELEAYCRRFLIPYFDIGMDVRSFRDSGYLISGQAIASLPGRPCMRCMGFLTEARLAQEAENYGHAGDKPQVIWPNALLASTAVGMFVSLVTPWNKIDLPLFIEYDGNRHHLRPSSVLALLQGECKHYPMPDGLGDPMWEDSHNTPT